jgi:hypothetical protein
MSPDRGSGELGGLFKAALGELDKWKRPRERTIFSRDMALGGKEKTSFSRWLAPFSPHSPLVKPAAAKPPNRVARRTRFGRP